MYVWALGTRLVREDAPSDTHAHQEAGVLTLAQPQLLLSKLELHQHRTVQKLACHCTVQICAASTRTTCISLFASGTTLCAFTASPMAR